MLSLAGRLGDAAGDGCELAASPGLERSSPAGCAQALRELDVRSTAARVDLLDGYALREVTRLIDIRAPQNRGVVRE
jgi:hypothetical protein